MENKNNSNLTNNDSASSDESLQIAVNSKYVENVQEPNNDCLAKLLDYHSHLSTIDT
jgi:hypothetical protein